MHRTTKIKITELNPHVICALCGGYYVNATTIIECLHSFCGTCITRYLETSKHCPICDVMVHKTRPLEHIRSDKTLQDLVYKLVPGLYKNEMKRRREYYVNMPGADTAPPSEDLGYEFHDRIIYTEDEKISLSLELCAEGVPFKTPSSIHGHNGPDNIKISDARYLSCPAGFSVGNLKKFIRMKFDLKRKYEIDIFHTAEPLQEYYNLMDIAYIYTWTRRSPLRLYYTVYERKRPPNISVPTVEQITDVINDGEKVLSETETIADTVKVGNKPETVAHRKRKLPQGPDDVSPNLDELKKSHEHTNKKDGGNHKKRVRKTTVDDTVLEAMSESEEQLAKLSLDCSTDASGLTVLDNKETCKRSDSDCHKYHDNDSALVNKTLMTETDTRTESAKDNGIGENSCIPSMSRLLPLNNAEGTKEKDASKIYEFSHNEPEQPIPVKPKGMPGRKKKILDDVDAHPSKKMKQPPPHQLPAHLTSEINLVVSNKHPGVKTPRKYTKKISNEKIDTPKSMTDIKTPVKVRKKPGPKTKNRDKDDYEITRKPKNKSKKDSIVETDITSDNKDKTTEFSVANLLVETTNVIDIPHMGPIIDSTTKSLETDTLQSNVVESTVEKTNANINCDSNEAEQSRNDDGVLQETVTSSNGFISSVSGMEATSPVSKFTHHCVSTPLYGNTPKMPDLNNIEPISPKGPEFRAGFCLEPNFNGATTNKDAPLNHLPLTNSFNNMSGINSPNYQAVVGGFSHQENSDQPLDLTNNGNREEYTKGKIFKTKMLRKPYPKLDTLSPQKDRLIQQNGNGYIVSVTADHRPLM